LEAADGAAPLLMGRIEPDVYCKCACKRMSAGMHALIRVHEDTLRKLDKLDKKFTNQWVGTNVGNTTTASLGIASAVMLFVAPPVGIGLGIGSAVTGSLSFAGDSIADRLHCLDFRRRISVDSWNVVAVSELVEQWLQALTSTGASLGSAFMAMSSAGPSDVQQMSVALVDGGLAVGQVSQGGASTAVRTLASSSGVALPASAIASAIQILGVAGAVLQTGSAIRGWTSMKAGQSIVRDKVRELKLGIVRTQHLLAAMDRLECHVCAEAITLVDDVRRCEHFMHCYHASCVKPAGGFDVFPCRVCGSSVSVEAESMVDSVQNWTDKLDHSPRRQRSRSQLPT